MTTPAHLPDPDTRRTARTKPNDAAVILSDLLARKPSLAGMALVGVRVVGGACEGA